MAILLRYACLLGLGLASLYVFVSAGSVTGQMMVASGSASAIQPQDVSVWVLGMFVMASLFSLARFMFRSMPSMLMDWCRNGLTTLAMTGIVCVAFLVL